MHYTLATIDIQSIRDALAAYDAAVFSAINIGMGASWLDPVMIAITIIGIGATQAGIGLVTIAAGIAAKKSELRSLGYAILIACIGAFVFSHIAKTYCDRPRPVMLIYISGCRIALVLCAASHPATRQRRSRQRWCWRRICLVCDGFCWPSPVW